VANTDSTLEVQKAVVAALKADADVTALVSTRIYDRVPQAATFPYVEIHDALGQPAVETRSGEGFEVLLTLGIWSRSQAGTVEAKQIAAAIVDVLNNSTLTLDTKTVVMTLLQDQRVSPLSDGVQTQVIQRWQFVTDG